MSDYFKPIRFEPVDFGPPLFAPPAKPAPRPAPDQALAPEPSPPAGVLLGRGRYPVVRHDYRDKQYTDYEYEDVHLLDSDWDRHIYINGETGGGKSNLILRLIARDQEVGTGFFLFDVDGKLTRDVIARTQPDHLPRLRIVELDPAAPIGINFFDCTDRRDDDAVQRTVERFVNVFRKAPGASAWSERVEVTLENLAYAFVANPGANLAQVPDFLTNPAARQRLLRAVENRDVRDYWEEFDGFTPTQQRDRTELVIRKVRRCLQNGTLRKVFSAPETTVDVRRAMAEGWNLILLLPDKRGAEVRAMLGSYFVELLLEATFDRADMPPSLWRPFHIYADEYQELCTPTTATFLKRTRKYKISLLIAHQTREPDLDAANLSATLQAGTIIAMASDPGSTADLAKRFRDVSGRDLGNLPPFHAQVRLAHTARQYRVRMEKADTERWNEEETADLLEAIRERSLDRFAQPPPPPETRPEPRRTQLLAPPAPTVGMETPEEPVTGVGEPAEEIPVIRRRGRLVKD